MRSEAEDRPQRLAVVLPDLGPGGAQTVAVWLLERLVSEGIECSVIETADSPQRFHQLGSGIDIRQLRSPSRVLPGIGRAIVRTVRLRRGLRSAHPEVVLAMVGATNVIATIAGLGQPWRTVISERNDPLRQRLRPPWNWLRRIWYPRADVVTANTVDAGRVLSRWLGRERVRVIPNAVQVPTEDQRAAGDQCTVITVGRLHPQKAQDVLIDAWARVAESYPGWKLVIVGDGELRGELEQMSSDLGVGGRVEFRGQVTDVPAELRAASIFALPSRYEGTPNALLEAMAHGLACVVSDASPGPLALVRDGETGLVVPVDDAEALATALTRLIEDARLRSRLGESARASMQSRDPEHVLELWKAVLFGDVGNRSSE